MSSPRTRLLLQEKKRLLKQLARLSNLIRGSLVRGTKKCGRKGCKCETGELHPHVVISTHRQGKSHIVYVPKACADRAAAAVSAYAQAKDIIERISCINIELLKEREL